MRRPVTFLVGTVALALFALSVVSSVAATPNVGQHIHIEVANQPQDGVPITRTKYAFAVTIRLHAFPANVQYLRVDDEAGTTKAKLTFSPALAGGTDKVYSFPFTVDFSAWSVGRHEMRWHADSKDADPNTADTQRQYTTSRAQVCVASCLPNTSGRAANWHGGGSWYTGPGYVVPLMTSPDSSVTAGGTLAIRSQYSGATACGFLNPHFHDLDHGTALGCGTSVTVPSTAVTGDRVVIVAIGKQEAGVLELHIGDPGFMGTQSWWAKSGLVLP